MASSRCSQAFGWPCEPFAVHTRAAGVGASARDGKDRRQRLLFHRTELQGVLRIGIAGEPAAYTTGRVVPRFDPEWLKVWVEMVDTEIDGWQRKRKRAQGVGAALKAKL
jgi:hypothetical protein